ncbi:hypothetical protein CLTEP_20120 [Clostridium tepidiprofundi DSM 19306]|uniref:Twitching motility protein PilT n=1 Tax=Clostridium tepidiprofundi DSM 19306 TaxID=1121338 RepID=A0A151B2F3_9CLOT|nr:hypothetical protein [Clostridium tepidiprofundi]KYH34066.1 hypothetical protein CLTEP_20120 [Clostridium tepidiprofundi DSM 19306]
MVQVFCSKKGSGKTKALLEMANNRVNDCKGHIVYIDDDDDIALRLDRKIRFICTNEFEFENFSNFYGLICGILSEDYDIDTIFIDGLLNIAHAHIKDAEKVLNKTENLSKKFNVDFYINISCKIDEAPQFIKKYVK